MVAIGVAGHRFLAEPGRVLDALEVVAVRLAEQLPGPWTVVSALAEGADRIAAGQLLARPGSRLVVVLPLPRDDYETDFATPASRDEFRRLLARADEVVTVDPQPDRDAAYEAGGIAMLDRSDVLLAVWDGRSAQGRGGTADIVARARERALPLAWVHAGNRRPGTEQPTSLGEGQGAVTFERLP